MKLTLNMLARQMAADLSVSATDAEAFISAYFAEISETIVSQGAAKVKGLGSFSRTVVDGNPTVDFVPSPELSGIVNAPFSFFEAVELNDGVTEEMLEAAAEICAESDTTNPPATDMPAERAEKHTESPSDMADVVEEKVEKQEEQQAEVLPVDDTQQPVPACDEDVTEIPVVQLENVAIAGTDSFDESEIPAISSDNNSPRKFRTIGLIASLATCLAIGFFSGIYYERCKTQPSDSHIPKEKPVTVTFVNGDSSVVEPAATAAAAVDSVTTASRNRAAVTDTVRASYYFTHMAKKHYGNKHFWSYIYEENRDKLGHPERVMPGLVVIIPPAEKYGIDASNPQSISAAKALSYEIYGRFSSDR